MHTHTSAQSITSLESELLAIPCLVAATKYRGLRILAELDARDAWKELGYPSGVHWLGARLGLNRRTAADQLRVARALVTLPLIASAFEQGRISYSKVRAITRTANPENERALLELAATHTSAALERLSQPGSADRSSSTRLASGELRWRWDEDGNLRVRLRLPSAQGTRFIEELEDLMRRMEQSARPDERTSAARASESRRAEALLSAVTTHRRARAGHRRAPVRRPGNRRHGTYPPAWSAALERREARTRAPRPPKPRQSMPREPGIPAPRRAVSSRGDGRTSKFRQ